VNLTPHIPVAIFLTSFHPGGTERQMIELVQRLDRRRFDVHAACFHREGAWLPRVEACAPIAEFPIAGFTRPATLARAAEFARWCRARRIAALLACDFYANTFALPAAAVAGVPVRLGSRRELAPDKSAAQIALQRQAYRFASAIVANSSAAADRLRREGIASDRIRVIPNGVSLDRFASAREARPIRTLLTVANLRKEKAHEVLFDAVARLAPAHPELRLRVAGDGPRAAELRALAASLGIADRVALLGHREDIAALLEEADAFVLPSRSEAFPNSVVEAMAAGLPVVAGAVGGLPELVDSGRTGVLVPVDNPAAMAEALESLITDPPRASAMGDAARETIAHRYSFDRMVRAFEDLFVSQLQLSSRAA
jgi:glycosyltransferase involved in cell wall biosynthesis